jgi:hypothetical protein
MFWIYSIPGYPGGDQRFLNIIYFKRMIRFPPHIAKMTFIRADWQAVNLIFLMPRPDKKILLLSGFPFLSLQCLPSHRWGINLAVDDLIVTKVPG